MCWELAHHITEIYLAMVTLNANSLKPIRICDRSPNPIAFIKSGLNAKNNSVIQVISKINKKASCISRASVLRK